MITITIDTNNAAFDGNPSIEVARLLRKLAGMVEDSYDFSGSIPRLFLRDVNGNTCGNLTQDCYDIAPRKKVVVYGQVLSI